MSVTVGGQVIPNARIVAIRAVFTAMFDAVDTISDWNEDRWVHLIAAFNETGRVVFGWPQLESSESDIFGALDDIAMQLDGTKTAMELTAKDTRIVLHQLHEALDPLLPEEEPTEPGPDPPLLETAPLVDVKLSLSPATNSSSSPTSSAEIVNQLKHSDQVDRRSESLAPVSEAAKSSPEPNDPLVDRRGEPQTPDERDERMFTAIRAGAADSYAALDRVVNAAPSTAYQRFDLLERYGTLPQDMVDWRRTRRGKTGNRGDPKPTAVVQEQPEPETFEERRSRLARERANRSMESRRREKSAVAW